MFYLEIYFSFRQCIFHCESVLGCVGFAHKENECSLCRIDTASAHPVPINDRKQYMILMDHLLLLPTIKGETMTETMNSIKSVFFLF